MFKTFTGKLQYLNFISCISINTQHKRLQVSPFSAWWVIFQRDCCIKQQTKTFSSFYRRHTLCLCHTKNKASRRIINWTLIFYFNLCVWEDLFWVSAIFRVNVYIHPKLGFTFNPKGQKQREKQIWAPHGTWEKKRNLSFSGQRQKPTGSHPSTSII